MNVMVYNKYKEMLTGLNIEVMKSLEGVYNVDEIIDTFANFYYDKMILDITAIRDYQNTDNLQKLAMNINMENVILLLDDSPETESKSYLSKLISLGIYNFTKNAEGINYLLVHPHTYRDVVNIHNLQDLEPTPEAAPQPQQPQKQTVVEHFIQEPAPAPAPSNNGGGKLKIIGFKNVTSHAGSTSLIYMLKKTLSGYKNVSAIEVDKVDFLYFGDEDMVSANANDLLREIMKRNACDIIFVDLNSYEDVDICTEVYYLIEPSTIMINRMMRKNKGILEKLKATFEYETKLNVLFAIPPVDDRQENIEPIRRFASKINL